MLNVAERRGALIVSLLQGGHSAQLTAFGTSMRPAILPGDKITVAPTTREELRNGDVVLFIRSQQLVVHRVIALAPLTTRGDAFASPDASVAAGALLGRVVKIESRSASPLLRRYCPPGLAWLGL